MPPRLMPGDLSITFDAEVPVAEVVWVDTPFEVTPVGEVSVEDILVVGASAEDVDPPLEVSEDPPIGEAAVESPARFGWLKLLDTHSAMGYIALGVITVSLSLFVYKRDLLVSRLLGREDPKQGPRDRSGNRQDRDKDVKHAGEAATERHGLSPRPAANRIDAEENNASPQITPKAQARTTDGDPIPSFILDEDESIKMEGHVLADKKETAMENIAASQQKQQSNQLLMPSPACPNPNTKRKPATAPRTLMPPPSRPSSTVSTLKAPLKPSSTLRPPPSAASTLRGPSSRSLPPTPSSLAPSTSTLSPSSRPSKKVLLSPGHSPLDWAHLIKNPPTPTYLRGASVPPHLIRVPPSLLKYHNGRKGKDAWGVWQGKVYNLTPYMKFHPGGESELMKGAGRERDAERLFLEVHPWVNWEGMLGECLVGILVGENEVGREGEGGLEEMD